MRSAAVRAAHSSDVLPGAQLVAVARELPYDLYQRETVDRFLGRMVQDVDLDEAQEEAT